MLFIGPEAELRFGYRHFMELTTAFTAMPQFTVWSGREEIGRTDPALLTAKIDWPRLLLLAGHSWRVTWIDFKRRRCFVEPADGGGKARWIFPGTGGASFALRGAVRDVLLGADPPAPVTSRAEARLACVFFQAEDGIRDWSVTGVQTCLPIWCPSATTTAPVSVAASTRCVQPCLRA